MKKKHEERVVFVGDSVNEASQVNDVSSLMVDVNESHVSKCTGTQESTSTTKSSLKEAAGNNTMRDLHSH